LAALVSMAATEADPVAKAAFLMVWELLNFFWLAPLRRPVVAALISLEPVAALTPLSRFKNDKLWMTVAFVDFLLGFTLRPHSIGEKTAIVARFVERWMPPLLAKQVEP
jgi:hypothetical protein